MGHAIETFRDALDRLAARGYAHELIADGGRLRDLETGERHDPSQLAITEVARFEGASDPDEQAILYALADRLGHPLGTYATVYGPITPPDDVEVVRQLGAKG
jgi:hypothetical protein